MTSHPRTIFLTAFRTVFRNTCLIGLLVAGQTAVLSADEPKADSEVLLRCDFESDDWWRTWGERESPKRVDLVANSSQFGFEPFDGRALRIRIDQGGHYGLSLAYRFSKQLGWEPEAVRFSYRIRLGDDWDPKHGGKLPGIAATYNRAGWGGRRVDGTDGWSARGLFVKRQDGKTPIGFYCYHADMKGRYGSHWQWADDGFEGLENNRWYEVEQFVRLNTPGKNDGVLRGWVDNRLVFEKTDVRFRDVDSLKIETVWVNVYYGGTAPSKTQQHLFLDDLIISGAER